MLFFHSDQLLFDGNEFASFKGKLPFLETYILISQLLGSGVEYDEKPIIFVINI